jgi:hypothetical protein
VRADLRILLCLAHFWEIVIVVWAPIPWHLASAVGPRSEPSWDLILVGQEVSRPVDR